MKKAEGRMKKILRWDAGFPFSILPSTFSL